jgi:UDP-glucose 4-epimerase
MVKRVLITGGSGFIGANLVNSLIKLDYDIVVVDIKNFDKKNNLFHLRKKQNFKYLKYDLFKKKLYNKIKKKVNIVIHLASGVGVNSYIKDPYNLIMSIFNPTVNLLDFSKKHKAHFIFASTSEIYGRNSEFPWKESDDRVLGPTTISRWSYSTVKATCEHLIFGFKKCLFDISIISFIVHDINLGITISPLSAYNIACSTKSTLKSELFVLHTVFCR